VTWGDIIIYTEKTMDFLILFPQIDFSFVVGKAKESLRGSGIQKSTI